MGSRGSSPWRESRLPGLVLVLFLTVGAGPVAALRLFLYGNLCGELGPLTGGKAAQVAAFLEKARREDPASFVFCAGDALGPGRSGDLDGGRLAYRLLARSGVDATGVGPYEFFAGWGNFVERVAAAGLPVVASNLDPASSLTPCPSLRPFLRLRKGDDSVVVLSVISPELARGWPGWPAGLALRPPREALESLHGEVKEGDWVVLLSSMGLEENLRLMKALPWIDVLVATASAGKEASHESLREMSLLGGRRYVQTFWGGDRLSRLDLRRGAREIEGGHAFFEVDESWPEDPVAAALIRRDETRARSLQAEELCVLDEASASDVTGTLLDALRLELDGEVAVIDLASIQVDRLPLRLTEGDLRAAYPYQGRAVLLDVPGARLRRIWERRDEALEFGQGMRLTGMAQRGTRVLVNGRPLRDGQRYRVATTEYLTRASLGLFEAGWVRPRSESVQALLRRSFQGFDPVRRRRRLVRLANRPIRTGRLALDWSLEQLSFAGQADAQQYEDPASYELGSDVPGLVGYPHRYASVRFETETVSDWVEGDLTCRLAMGTGKYGAYRSSDLASLTLRWEADTAAARRGRWFGEIDLEGTLLAPDLADRERPFFGKALGGWSWQRGPHLKGLGALGWLRRWSQPGDPASPGLNVAVEFERALDERLTLRAHLDCFGAVAGERARSLDGTLRLEMKLWKNVALTMRYRRFGWNDDFVDGTAWRSELDCSLGWHRAFRRF